MRTWGRTTDEMGNKTWALVETDANGFDDYVWATTLIQCLKLSLGEDPMFANYGIPAQRSVLTQIFPDFYTYQTQQQFSQYFVSLTVQKLMSPTPTYDITAVTHSGVVIQDKVAA
jgi:hypothetical protein